MEFFAFKIRFRISFLFVALMCVMIIFDESYYLLLSFLFVFLHETAHIAAMKICGTEIKEVYFEPFGVLI